MGIANTFQRWLHSFRAGQPPTAIDLETCNIVDTSTWPLPTKCLVEEETTDPFLRSIKTSTEFLDIKVGGKRNARRWKVHKALIYHYSENFQLRESSQSAFDLGQYRPTAFKLFIDWLYATSKTAHDFVSPIQRTVNVGIHTAQKHTFLGSRYWHQNFLDMLSAW
ncbi:hypothetical protein GQ44DRAFT_777608 [Phaeosphaeriaceae sp. PMI808]|nr:hypothetical protein GQ44DRAFT_777608 [Phaeosphaeriaceae sp. PMI808]